jgi:hypothetical protein
VPEALEELAEVFHGRVAEDFGFTVFLARKAFGEMGDDFEKFVRERLLGKLHRFFEPSADATGFLFVQLRADLPQVLGWLERRKVPCYGEQVRE